MGLATPDGYEGAEGLEEDEMPEQVTIRTDATAISWSIFTIITVLISITCIFEEVQEIIYEHTPPSSLPIIDALFSEMTVLGFLSMVTFLVSSGGYITKMSIAIFGDEDEGPGQLKELFEQAHYMLFLIMVVFFMLTMNIARITRATIRHWRGIRKRILRPELVLKMLAIARKPPPTGAHKAAWIDACEALEYASMRREFIHGRRGEPPHQELDLKSHLPLDFDYAKYLEVCMGKCMARTIVVSPTTWLLLWLLNIAFTCFVLAQPSIVIVAGAWSLLCYVEAACIAVFHQKLADMRLCMCCPSEVPHVKFSYDPASGMPSVRLHEWAKARSGDAQGLTHSHYIGQAPSLDPWDGYDDEGAGSDVEHGAVGGRLGQDGAAGTGQPMHTPVNAVEEDTLLPAASLAASSSASKKKKKKKKKEKKKEEAGSSGGEARSIGAVEMAPLRIDGAWTVNGHSHNDIHDGRSPLLSPSPSPNGFERSSNSDSRVRMFGAHGSVRRSSSSGSSSSGSSSGSSGAGSKKSAAGKRGGGAGKLAAGYATGDVVYSLVSVRGRTGSIRYGSRGVVQGPCNSPYSQDAGQKVLVQFDSGMKVNIRAVAEVSRDPPAPSASPPPLPAQSFSDQQRQQRRNISIHERVAHEELVRKDAPRTKSFMVREEAVCRDPPAWSFIVTDTRSRSSLRSWVCGRAPFRQLYLYWFEANGPVFHEMVVRLHLIYTSLFVAMHLLVFTPLIAQEFGVRNAAAYAVLPAPALFYTMGKRFAVLVRNVTELGVVGVLQDRPVKKEVLRRMKTEKSMKAILLLQKMRNRVSSSASGNSSTEKTAAVCASRPPVLSGRRSRDDGYGSVGTTKALRRDGDSRQRNRKAAASAAAAVAESEGEGAEEPFWRQCAVRAYEEHFDRLQDGFVTRVDFVVGLKELFARREDATAVPGDIEREFLLLFSDVDVDDDGKIDFPEFVAFFEACVAAAAPSSSSSSSSSSSLLPANTRSRYRNVSAGSPSVAAIGRFVESCRDEAQNEATRAEVELAALKREHGLAVHEIEAMFTAFDTDGSGTLDLDEVQVMLGSLGHTSLTDEQGRRLLQELDKDGNGTVSMAEFIVWCWARQSAEENKEDDIEEMCGKIFDETFDDTQDGRVDVMEFISGLERAKSELSYDEKHELFKEADCDSNGSIDREEFVKMMTKYCRLREEDKG